MALPKSVLTTTEAFLIFHRVAHVEKCLGEGQLHAKMEWKTACGIGAAVQKLTRAWTVLSKLLGQGSLQIAYLLYVLYERTMAMLQVMKSPEDGFSALSQREIFDAVKGPVSGEEKIERAA